MNFKFKYKVLHILSCEKESGYYISIDSNYNTIECSSINNKEEILNSKYISIDLNLLNIILNIIQSNMDIFNLNSILYSEGEYSDVEQEFYFELDDKNRKIEGNNIRIKYSYKNEVKLLLKVFDLIAAELLKVNIKIDLDCINII